MHQIATICSASNDNAWVPITLVEHEIPFQMMAVVTGEMGMEELLAFAAAQRVGERRAWALIFDVSGAIVNLSSADVQEVAEFSAQSPIGPVAIIASENSLFGVARMFQTYSAISGRENVGVFRTFDEAQSWLSNRK